MTAILKILDHGARLLSRAGAIMSMVILVAMVLLILVEIVLRAAFSRSTFFSVEIVGYGMATMTFLALGQTMREGGLIKVNALTNVLSPFIRRVLGSVVAVVTLTVFVIPVWVIGRSVIMNYSLGYKSLTIAEVPLWIPEGMMWVGILVFWFQLLAHMIRFASDGIGVEKPDLTLMVAID